MATEIRPTCPDCGAGVGEVHLEGCDVERCTHCNMQRLGCDSDQHDPVAAAWEGEWPGVRECRERGWYAIFVPNKGWQSCTADTPGATEDLNRLAEFYALNPPAAE